MFDQKIRRIVSIGFFVSFVFFLFSFSFGEGNFGDIYVQAAPGDDNSLEHIDGASTGVTTGEKIKSEKYDVKSGKGYVEPAIKEMLFGLVQFIALLITFCVKIINWTLTPAFVSTLLNNTGIYTGWSTVRDFLNIFFIFFLLFSAFSTIFQVSKYHIKSTWVMIVVMALLVNFSWPIARVIIDVSNVAMTQMLGKKASATNSGDNLMSQIGGGSRFAKILIGQGSDDNKVDLAKEGIYPVLFLSIMIGFLFLITIGAIAVILVIRGIALAVLLVFASVGFTMAAFPTTRSFANQWWSALIKYAFIGPILLFTLILSVSVMKASGDAGFTSGAPVGGGQLENITKTFMQFSVAIVLIWTGIIAASKLGDGASSMVVGKANAAAKWGGRKIKGQTWDRGAKGVAAGAAAGKWVGRQAKQEVGARFGITALKRRGQDKFKQMGKKTEKRREGMIADSRAYSKDQRKSNVKNLHNKNVLEAEKDIKEKGVSNEDAMTKAITEKDAAKKQAYIQHAMKSAKFGKDEAMHADFTKLISSLNVLSDTEKEVMQGNVNKKFTEKGNAHVVYENEIEKNQSSGLSLADAQVKARNSVFGNMDAKTYAKQGRTIEKVAANKPTYMAVGDDLNVKLNRASFARDMQSVNQETYAHLETINNTNL